MNYCVNELTIYTHIQNQLSMLVLYKTNIITILSKLIAYLHDIATEMITCR